MLADKLRKSVLQSAIQGKLTEQLATDDKVEDLLQAIKEEKELLIKEKKIKKQKPLPEITEEEIPFAIPENWKWVRLGEIGITQTGNTPSRLHSEYIGNDIPFITPKDISDKGIIYNNQGLSELGKTVARICNKDTILQVCIGGSIGKTNIVNREVAFNQQINSIYPIFCISRYVFMVMQSAYFIIKMRNKAGGTATPIINRGIWDTILIPLPSLAEQKRIVEKLDNVLANIEKLKSSEEKLSILQKNFPDKLKKSILQSAIQGKLTEQLATDDNVEDLLQAIKEEKERLIKEKKIKKQKPLPEITEEEIPFTIPENWKWVRLGEIFFISRGGSPRPIKSFLTDSEDGINWIKISDTNKDSKYIISCKEKIIKDGLKKSRFVKNGDLLLTNSMSFGKAYILKIDGCIHDGWLCLSPIKDIDKEYIYYVLMSNFLKHQFITKASGAVVRNLNIDKVNSAVVPLPPLAEQKRIVEKLDKLLADIEELKI